MKNKFSFESGNVFLESFALHRDIVQLLPKDFWNKNKYLEELGFFIKFIPRDESNGIYTIPKNWKTEEISSRSLLLLDTESNVRGKITGDMMYIYTRYTMLFGPKDTNIFKTNNMLVRCEYITLYDRKEKNNIKTVQISQENNPGALYVSDSKEFLELIAYMDRNYDKWYLPSMYW